jgi:hypothetical protein
MIRYPEIVGRVFGRQHVHLPGESAKRLIFGSIDKYRAAYPVRGWFRIPTGTIWAVWVEFYCYGIS